MEMVPRRKRMTGEKGVVEGSDMVCHARCQRVVDIGTFDMRLSEHVTNELATDGFPSTQTTFDDIVD